MTRLSTLLRKGFLAAALLSAIPAIMAQGPGIGTLTPPTLESALKSGKWLIVEFGGQTCIPCARMQPVLMELQKKLGANGRVYNFWIQEHADTARRFGIMVMPTQIVFDLQGKEILRHQGFWELEMFQKALKDKGVL